MLRFSRVVSSFALGVLAACTAGNDTDGAQGSVASAAHEDLSVTPPELVAHGVFDTDAHRLAFENDVLPATRAYLAHWAKVGFTTPHLPARFYVSPPPGTKSVDTLPQLYGADIFDRMTALEAAVAGAANKPAAIDLIDAFTCQNPPLDRKFMEDMEKYVVRDDVTVAMMSTALKGAHDKLRAPSGTFTFRTDNGEFELPKRQNCSYMLLGHATTATRAHPYLEKDVIAHELGHAFHYQAWLATGKVGERLSSSLNESLADIFAHTPDGDPCHGKVLDEHGAVVGCRRNMKGFEASVSDAVWSAGHGTHDTGQALRDFVWTLRDQVSAEDLQFAIRKGTERVIVALRRIDAEPLANVPLFDDDILAMRYRFAREYDATGAFFDGVCDALGGTPAACSRRAEYIGDARVATMAELLANAPTAIGTTDRTLPDGSRVAFLVQGAYIKEMRVTTPAGASVTFSGSPDVLRSGATRDITLMFRGAGTSQATWSSRGVLTLTP